MFVKKHNQSVMIDKLEKNIPAWLESATVRQFGDKARDRYSVGLLEGGALGATGFIHHQAPLQSHPSPSYGTVLTLQAAVDIRVGH